MKKRNWLCAVLILACLAVFMGYRTLTRIRTDTTPPEITIDDQVPEISVRDPLTALLQGVTATDDTDRNVTPSVVVERIELMDSAGNLTVTYAAFDRAGNVAKAQRAARFTDYESPRFTLDQPLLYPYGSSFDILSTMGAVDVLDGDIQHRIRATSLDENTIDLPGKHNVLFLVTNSLGDSVSLTFPVEVYDPSQYDATLALTDYLIYLPVGASFEAEDYLSSFTLRGETTNLTGRLPRDFTLRTTGTVNTAQPGIYVVELRVVYTQVHETDPEFDKEYTGYSKLIIVVEE